MPTDSELHSPAYAPFRIDVHPERDAVRVAPAGELDIATADALAEQLRELRSSGFDRVVLDLRELSFIDSSGIRVVLAEHRDAERGEREFSLICGPPAVQRALELCGLLEHLHVQEPGGDA